MAVASRFVLLNDEQVKEFSESFDNENTKKKTLYDLKVFKEFLDTCDEKREIEDIVPVTWSCKKSSKNLFSLCERKMVKSTNPRQSERSYKASTGIFQKTIMDFPSSTTKSFMRFKIFKKKTVKIRGQRKPAKRSGSVVG